MQRYKKLRLPGIFLILFLISCQTVIVKIEPIRDFKNDYIIEETATENEIYQHAIITGKREIDYLRKYIEILINRVLAANKQRIEIIDLRSP